VSWQSPLIIVSMKGRLSMSDLFRKEAVAHATQRLAGAVVLATPLSVRLLGLFFAGVVFAAVSFASMASYARKATVSGWLVPDLGLIRVTASSAGFIQSVPIGEGELVAAGARLAEIRIGTETATGNVGERFTQQLRAEADGARAKARSQIERLDAESQQSLERLAKLHAELVQVQTQAALQERRLVLAQQDAERSEATAAKARRD
jgi:membrane fusion protein